MAKISLRSHGFGSNAIKNEYQKLHEKRNGNSNWVLVLFLPCRWKKNEGCQGWCALNAQKCRFFFDISSVHGAVSLSEKGRKKVVSRSCRAAIKRGHDQFNVDITRLTKHE